MSPMDDLVSWDNSRDDDPWTDDWDNCALPGSPSPRYPFQGVNNNFNAKYATGIYPTNKSSVNFVKKQEAMRDVGRDVFLLPTLTNLSSEPDMYHKLLVRSHPNIQQAILQSQNCQSSMMTNPNSGFMIHNCSYKTKDGSCPHEANYLIELQKKMNHDDFLSSSSCASTGDIELSPLALIFESDDSTLSSTLDDHQTTPDDSSLNIKSDFKNVSIKTKEKIYNETNKRTTSSLINVDSKKQGSAYSSAKARISPMDSSRCCINCATTQSVMWRRVEEAGGMHCNACALYRNLHGFPRPPDLFNKPIRTRNRKRDSFLADHL